MHAAIGCDRRATQHGPQGFEAGLGPAKGGLEHWTGGLRLPTQIAEPSYGAEWASLRRALRPSSMMAISACRRDGAHRLRMIRGVATLALLRNRPARLSTGIGNQLLVEDGAHGPAAGGPGWPSLQGDHALVLMRSGLARALWLVVTRPSRKFSWSWVSPRSRALRWFARKSSRGSHLVSHGPGREKKERGGWPRGRAVQACGAALGQEMPICRSGFPNHFVGRLGAEVLDLEEILHSLKPIQIGETELTCGALEAVVGANPKGSAPPGGSGFRRRVSGSRPGSSTMVEAGQGLEQAIRIGCLRACVVWGDGAAGVDVVGEGAHGRAAFATAVFIRSCS